jgi:photosystem II stability/assembly factor-like uncharacterized protein
LKSSAIVVVSVLIGASTWLSCSVVRTRSRVIDQEELSQSELVRGYVGLYFSSPQSGHVFTETEILRTADGGQSWQLLQTVTRPQLIRQLFFLDANTAWLCTDKRDAWPAFLSRTTNGFVSLERFGVNFQRHDKAGTSWVSDVFFIDLDRGWAAGGSGHVAVTTDGGRTWTGFLVPTQLGQPERIAMFPPAGGFSPSPGAMPSPVEGIAATDVGMIHTTDGGVTWQAIPKAPTGLKDLRCVGRSICMALDTLNEVYASVDGGISWQKQAVPVDAGPDPRDEVTNLQLASPTRAYIFGVDTHIPPPGQREVVAPDGKLVRPRSYPTSFVVSYDGSAWTRRDYKNIAEIGTGQFVDDLNGWAVSYNNNIFRTSDGGRTWTTVQDYFRQMAARMPSPR